MKLETNILLPAAAVGVSPAAGHMTLRNGGGGGDSMISVTPANIYIAAPIF